MLRNNVADSIGYALHCISIRLTGHMRKSHCPSMLALGVGSGFHALDTMRTLSPSSTLAPGNAEMLFAASALKAAFNYLSGPQSLPQHE